MCYIKLAACLSLFSANHLLYRIVLFLEIVKQKLVQNLYCENVFFQFKWNEVSRAKIWPNLPVALNAGLGKSLGKKWISSDKNG